MFKENTNDLEELWNKLHATLIKKIKGIGKKKVWMTDGILQLSEEIIRTKTLKSTKNLIVTYKIITMATKV